jgi:hypothetical protein
VDSDESDEEDEETEVLASEFGDMPFGTLKIKKVDLVPVTAITSKDAKWHPILSLY